MKSHLKNTSIFKMGATKAIHVLTVAAVTVLATFLVSIPTPASATTTVALQCQVSTSGTSNTIACSGTLPPDVTGVLNCQSPNVVSNNNGVFTVAPATCSGNASVAGVNVTGTLSATVLTIDSNSGAITVTDGTGTLSYSQGLASVMASCQGAAFSQTLSPLALNIPDGTCNVNVGVLGIGTAQITTQSGSISATTSPPLILSINSPTASVKTSVLGLVLNITCGESINVNLNQLIPITVPLAPCSGS